MQEGGYVELNSGQEDDESYILDGRRQVKCAITRLKATQLEWGYKSKVKLFLLEGVIQRMKDRNNTLLDKIMLRPDREAMKYL